LTDGIAVTNVPAVLARRDRLLSTGDGRKTDEADTLAVGVAPGRARRCEPRKSMSRSPHYEH
jgi:transposase